MHWAQMNTKDRMLPDGSEAAASSSSASVASRRASEGGMNLGSDKIKWDAKSNADIINKFRNYEIWRRTSMKTFLFLFLSFFFF